jgi:hypothetical protein
MVPHFTGALESAFCPALRIALLETVAPETAAAVRKALKTVFII